MNKIHLKGGNIHYTEDSSTVYRVIKGRVLVFLMPVRFDRTGRRLLLGEMESESIIVGFHHESEMLGEWKIGLVAVEEAELIYKDGIADDDDRRNFLNELGFKIFDAGSYDEILIETYELNSIKDQGHIYSAQRDHENTRDSSLRMIYGLFRKRDWRGVKGTFIETGSKLYDAAAFICRRENIDIAPLERITDTSGRNYRIEDIARLSHFTIRNIVLEPGWHHRDTGSVLVFTEGGKRPMACVPRNSHSYYIYDPGKGGSIPLTDEIARTIEPSAWMFYRPFPEKAISIKDLFLFGMQKVSISDIVRVMLMAMIGILIGLLLPYMNEQAFDKFIPMGNAPGLLQLGAVILACTVGNMSFTIVKNLSSFRSMNTMEYAVQSATFDRLFNLPESFFRDYDSADLGQRAMGISTIYTIIAQNGVSAVLAALFSFFYLWMMYKYSAVMTIWGIVMLLIVAAFIILIGSLQIRYEKNKYNVDLAAQSVVFQLLSDVGKLRMSFAEDRAIHRYIEKAVESRRISNTIAAHSNLVNTIVGSASLIFSMRFYYLMIHNHLDLTIGEFSGFSAAFGAFSGAVLSLVQNYLIVNNVKPLYDQAKPILDTLPEIAQEADLPGKIMGEIEMSNVTFSYSDNESPVLKNISLRIRAGEYVGIVGSSGCGKSTLLKLLLGFEKPQSGVIMYDNHDINDLDKRELRKKFGVVLQNGGLISGSIYENITIAAPEVSLEQVEETIRAVGLEEDISKMPMGLHTVIADGAGTISGGQTQRILIARAIVGKPRIIFLDEATSALDNYTQSQIVDTLERLKATKVVIAHRLSTVENCDRIIVMDKGAIAEQGTYNELMDKRGLFYELARRQIA